MPDRKVGCGSAAAAALLFLVGCNAESGQRDSLPESGVAPVGFDEVDVRFVAGGGDRVEYPMWLAETPDQQHRGLTDVTDLGGPAGMVFRFEREGEYRFYMWQTPMPLDIFFFDDDGRFAGSAAMSPCLDGPSSNCERYSPDAPFLIAVEVPAGSFDDLAVDRTWSITIDDPADAQYAGTAARFASIQRSSTSPDSKLVISA